MDQMGNGIYPLGVCSFIELCAKIREHSLNYPLEIQCLWLEESKSSIALNFFLWEGTQVVVVISVFYSILEDNYG